MKAKPKTTYVTASPATWELIRAAYLSGQSAPTAAARFGVSVGALRKRAQRERWTKRAFVAGGPWALGFAAAVAAPSPVAPPEDAETTRLAALHARAMPPARHDPQTVARMAAAQASRALVAGDPDGALRHVRVASALVALDEKLDWDNWDADLESEEGRQSALDEMVFQIAGELAGLLVTGEPVPPGFLARAERWRAQYAAAGVVNEPAGE